MIKYFCLIVLIFTLPAKASLPCEVDSSSSTYNISENGKFIVLFDAKSNCVEVKANTKSYFLKLSGLVKVQDVKPNIEVAISRDSKYLMLQYDQSEYEHLVSIYSLPKLKLVHEKFASLGFWAANKAIYVPSYSKENLPNPQGLLVYEPAKNLMFTIEKQLAFTGKISSAGHFILADYLKEKSGLFIVDQIVIDLNEYCN